MTAQRVSAGVWLRALAAWLMIILAESVHGVLRRLWLVPALGEETAGRVGFLAGALIILAIAWLSIRWIGAASRLSLLAIGLAWALLTLGFEVALGRFALNYSWDRIAAEYDPARGGLMGIGMLVLLLAPLIAAKLRAYSR